MGHARYLRGYTKIYIADFDEQEPATGKLILGTCAEARIYVSGLNRYYIYILRRPDNRPFYVGKGKGDRVFQHENEARHKGNHPKLNVIHAIPLA